MLTLLDWVYLGLLLFGIGWAGILFIGGEFGAESDHDFDVGAHHDFSAGEHHVDVGHHDLAVGHHDLAVDTSAEAGHDLDTDVQHGASDHGAHLSPLSPIVLSTTLGAFGAFGLIARHFFRLPDVAGLPLALLGGLVLGAITFWFYGKVLLGAQGTSLVALEDFYGATGTVITPIPAGGTGEVSLIVRGQRINVAARSATGEAIPRNALVIVQEMQGPVALVRPTT